MMLVLGIQGSPRKQGNTAFLLSAFMKEVENVGALTHIIDVCESHIEPCKEYTTCEKTGFCPIKDDMDPEIYGLMRRADVIVTATPIFFYSTPAQLKALIDRSQTLWARKYRLKLTDPGRKWRLGLLLAQGATRGKNLFEGLHLTMKYFYDAVGADYAGSLTYRQVENRGDMGNHPTVLNDIKDMVEKFIKPLVGRKKVLFACRENACRSQMSSAFAQKIAGDRLDVFNAGSTPASQVNSVMVDAMREIGIDMAFRKTTYLDDLLNTATPDWIITMGCDEECPYIPGVTRQDWDLPDPAGQSMEVMRSVRDEIERRVTNLIGELL